MKKPPRVTLLGSSGASRVVMPRDDGTAEDVKAGDSFHTSVFPSFPDPKLKIEISSGDKKWNLDVKLDAGDDHAMIIAYVEDNGRVSRLNINEVMAVMRPKASAPEAPSFGIDPPREALHIHREKTGHTGAPRAPSDATKKSKVRAKLGPGFAIWAVLLVGFGLGLGVTISIMGRRSRPVARLAGVEMEGEHAPVRLQMSQVPAALAGPLSGHRVIAVGEADELELEGVIPCLDRGPLPDELVAAAEALSLTEGPSPALLILDADSLDRPGPAEAVVDLAAALSGRIPVWVVDGPEQWDQGLEDEEESTG